KFRDKVKDSRLFAGLVTGLAGLVGAGIMYLGMIWVGDKEDRSRTLDLLSNREFAAYDLQAQVFETYVQHIVPALDDSVDDSKKVALLAGLHSNFSEFFDTRPVFETFAVKVKDANARHELTRLAKRVARRQAEFIKAHQPIHEENIFVELTLHPGDTLISFNLAVHRISIRLIGVPRRRYKLDRALQLKAGKPALGDNEDDLIDDVSDYVAIKMIITGKDGTEKKPKPFTFELSYMDTPYMDNIWMRHSDGSHHQMALRLVDIDTKNGEHEVTIEFLHFPGDVYAATQRLPVKELLGGGHGTQKKLLAMTILQAVGFISLGLFLGIVIVPWVYRKTLRIQ
ncbi:MAG: hypothetical protein IIA60_05975, partial [Candidatus Marinimicrobia bacterium]|nr:hypothetical protein [Candidatus Neomarinimicrobiota bacterium]